MTKPLRLGKLGLSSLILPGDPMQFRCFAVALGLATLSIATPASACLGGAPLDLADARLADTVVVGRIVNYHMVLDPKIRRELKVRKGGFGNPDKLRFMPDYARFDIEVVEVLRGEAGARIAATWDNSTFPEPETMAPGPYLIALRRPGSSIPPLRGISATIAPAPERRTLTVLQAPCSVPFIFETGSAEAAGVRAVLAGAADRPRSAE